METGPITRSLNLPPTTAVVDRANAAEEVQDRTLETTKVTAPPATGDSAPHGGTSGQPGLGEKVDLYDTESAKLAADEKSATNTTTTTTPAGPDPQFPFLFPLGEKPSAPGSRPPGEGFDATA